MKSNGKGHSRKLTKSEQMARVRSKDTHLELQLRQALWANGFRYRIRPDLPGTPDLAFPKAKIAVFVDGCFWHGCPEHYTAPVTNSDFWFKKRERNTQRDRRADEALSLMGWQSVRVWEHEISGDLHEVISRIAIKLQPAT